MSIFSRIFKIGQASANKVVESFEKPELMLEQAIADKEKAEKFQWEQKAEAAMRSGREDLAVKALERASEHEARAASLEPSWQSQQSSVAELKQEVIAMEAEVAEYRRNKDFIIAQSKAAQVKKDIYEAKAKMTNKRSPDDLMARMKAKAERQGYEADAAKEMSVSPGGTSLEDEFKSLSSGAGSPDVQAKLDALKAKLGSVTPG
jgi:phage shock protein A